MHRPVLLCGALLGLLSASSCEAVKIPGLQYVGRGVDATTMSAGLFQVTDNTFTSWYTWKDPFSGVEYEVPEMMFATTATASTVKNMTALITDHTTYQQWAQHSRHWSSGLFGMDQHSWESYNYLKQKYKEHRMVSSTEMVVEYYRLWAPVPIPAVTSEFKTAVDALPADVGTKANYEEYKQFFRLVGSGVMTEAYMGGRFSVNTWVDDCVLAVTNITWVKQESGWTLFHLIGEHSGSINGHNTVSAPFAECSTTTTQFHGGKTTYSSPSDWQSWADSIMQRPVPVSYVMHPIYDAVSWDDNKAETMQTALDMFMQDANVSLAKYVEGLVAESNAVPFTPPDCCHKLP